MTASIRRHPRRPRGPMRAAALALLVVLAATIVVLGGTGPARADGDPASDELIAQNVFYPYSSSVPQSLRRRLDAAVSHAHDARLDLKIALIARPSDLGSVTALFGQPQRYAAFLDTELSFNRKIPLLIVMANGFGSDGLPSKLQRVVATARAPTADTGTALATAADSLVIRLDDDLHSGHAGHASTGGAGSNYQTRTILLLALILAALLVGGLLIIARVFFPPTA